ncbi:MAG: FG-GAP-like repeat-containing protein [Candidatus Heimdallarchaeaceae archaeon]
MKQTKAYCRKENKGLGLTIIVLFLIISQIVVSLAITENSDKGILNFEQNSLEDNSNEGFFKEAKIDDFNLEIDINKYKSEEIKNDYTTDKVSQALTSFGSWPIYVGGELKGGPGAGDIDGDGNYEIVVGTLNGLIRVYEIDGTESSNWSGGKNIGVAITSTPMLADIDGNSATEEIIVGTANSSVYAFFGNGSIIPGWPVNCESAVEETLAVGDIDGNGENEIVIGSNSSKVYAFNGDGTTVLGWPKTTGGEVIVAPVLADVDSDDISDIIVGSTDGKVYVWKGNGDTIANFPIDLTEPIVHPLAVADINKDGKMDIVCPAGKNLYLLANNGAIVHSWQTDSSAVDSIWLGPIIVDINWDREYEIVALSNAGEQKSFSFSGDELVDYSLYTNINVLDEPMLTDIDNDWDWELLYSSSSNIYAKHFYSSFTNEEILSSYEDITGIINVQGQNLFYSDSSGYILAAENSHQTEFDWEQKNFNITNNRFNSYINYYTELPYWPKTVGDYFSSLTAVADVDGDTELEIIAGYYGGVIVWNADGSVVPGWPKTVNGGCSSLAVADIDGDTELEIIAGYNGGVTVFNADGSIVPSWPKTVNDYCSSLAIADIDGDTKLEIIAAYSVEVIIWNGDGSIVPGWPKTVGGDCYSLAVADVDGDTKLEIIAAYSGGVIIWNADGSIVPGWPKTVGGESFSLAVADVDGDTKLEIIAGYSGVIVFNADGSIVSGWPKTVDSDCYSLAVADIDGDTELEIIAAYSGGVIIWNSDGTMLFNLPNPIADAHYSLAVADIDGDTELEIIAGYNGGVTVFNVDGSVVFGWPKTVNGVCSSLAVADVDGDTKLEIIAGNTGEVTVWNSLGIGYAPLITESVDNQRTGTYLDSDNDKLFDHEEELFGSDPNNDDTDSDGLLDYEEINYHTDPNNEDTDFDGLSDYEEINVYSTDPVSDDTDNDSLTDFDEVSVHLTEPNNSDTDSDGMYDGYEVYTGLDSLIDDANSDLDNDGLTNLEEFNLGTFANSTDTDSDSLDGC